MQPNSKYDQSQYVKKIKEYNSSLGYKPLACVQTYGCQQNVSDSEKMKGFLQQMGYEFTDQTEKADLILLNTCAVREHAELKIYGNVGALKRIKEKKPELVIALCGCMMQQEHIREKLFKSYPFVDIVFGTHAAPRLPELVYKHVTAKKRQFDIGEGEGCMAEYLPIHRDDDMKANLPIMHGCDNFCTYCVVPLVRGREKSRLPENYDFSGIYSGVDRFYETIL